MTHTKEPWASCAGLDLVRRTYADVMGPDGFLIAQTPWNKARDARQDEANTVRIVACVNALAGVDDPEAWVPFMRAEMERANEAAARVNAELSALRRVAAAAREALPQVTISAISSGPYIALRSALAALDGEGESESSWRARAQEGGA